MGVNVAMRVMVFYGGGGIGRSVKWWINDALIGVRAGLSMVVDRVRSLVVGDFDVLFESCKDDSGDQMRDRTIEAWFLSLEVH